MYISGNSVLPKIAVLAIVEPERDEKIVPPTIATRERRPGTFAINLSTASITGNFTGVTEKFVHTRMFDQRSLQFYVYR